jgi:hypothetical protein
LTGSGNTFLYQAYLGRVAVSPNETVDVFVDDHSIQTGSASSSVGNSARTWYDGISYGQVQPADPVSVGSERPRPIRFRLSQNYPNPFNPTTQISYSISKASQVSLKVYNLRGQEVRTLVDEFKQAGNYSYVFNADGLASGVYFYRLKVGQDFTSTKKMLFIR